MPSNQQYCRKGGDLRTEELLPPSHHNPIFQLICVHMFNDDVYVIFFQDIYFMASGHRFGPDFYRQLFLN